MTDNTKEREAFEKYCDPEGKWPAWFERDSKGNYKLSRTLGDWALWQAAWLASQSSAPAWIAVSERLPEIDMSAPEYMRNVRVLGAAAGSPWVGEFNYKSNAYAATEKGRAPRFEDTYGRRADHVTHWMPLPAPPCHQPQEPARGNEQ